MNRIPVLFLLLLLCTSDHGVVALRSHSSALSFRAKLQQPEQVADQSVLLQLGSQDKSVSVSRAKLDPVVIATYSVMALTTLIDLANYLQEKVKIKMLKDDLLEQGRERLKAARIQRSMQISGILESYLLLRDAAKQLLVAMDEIGYGHTGLGQPYSTVLRDYVKFSTMTREEQGVALEEVESHLPMEHIQKIQDMMDSQKQQLDDESLKITLEQLRKDIVVKAEEGFKSILISGAKQVAIHVIVLLAVAGLQTVSSVFGLVTSLIALGSSIENFYLTHKRGQRAEKDLQLMVDDIDRDLDFVACKLHRSVEAVGRRHESIVKQLYERSKVTPNAVFAASYSDLDDEVRKFERHWLDRHALDDNPDYCLRSAENNIATMAEVPVYVDCKVRVSKTLGSEVDYVCRAYGAGRPIDCWLLSRFERDGVTAKMLGPYAAFPDKRIQWGTPVAVESDDVEESVFTMTYPLLELHRDYTIRFIGLHANNWKAFKDLVFGVLRFDVRLPPNHMRVLTRLEAREAVRADDIQPYNRYAAPKGRDVHDYVQKATPFGDNLGGSVLVHTSLNVNDKAQRDGSAMILTSSYKLLDTTVNEATVEQLENHQKSHEYLWGPAIHPITSLIQLYVSEVSHGELQTVIRQKGLITGPFSPHAHDVTSPDEAEDANYNDNNVYSIVPRVSKKERVEETIPCSVASVVRLREENQPELAEFAREERPVSIVQGLFYNSKPDSELTDKEIKERKDECLNLGRHYLAAGAFSGAPIVDIRACVDHGDADVEYDGGYTRVPFWIDSTLDLVYIGRAFKRQEVLCYLKSYYVPQVSIQEVADETEKILGFIETLSVFRPAISAHPRGLVPDVLDSRFALHTAAYLEYQKIFEVMRSYPEAQRKWDKDIADSPQVPTWLIATSGALILKREMSLLWRRLTLPATMLWLASYHEDLKPLQKKLAHIVQKHLLAVHTWMLKYTAKQLKAQGSSEYLVFKMVVNKKDYLENSANPFVDEFYAHLETKASAEVEELSKLRNYGHAFDPAKDARSFEEEARLIAYLKKDIEENRFDPHLLRAFDRMFVLPYDYTFHMCHASHGTRGRGSLSGWAEDDRGRIMCPQQLFERYTNELEIVVNQLNLIKLSSKKLKTADVESDPYLQMVAQKADGIVTRSFDLTLALHTIFDKKRSSPFYDGAWQFSQAHAKTSELLADYVDPRPAVDDESLYRDSEFVSDDAIRQLAPKPAKRRYIRVDVRSGRY